MKYHLQKYFICDRITFSKNKRKKEGSNTIMSMIYFVITCIFAGLSFACSQIKWLYQKELFYIVLFITGIFFALIFVQQEENVNKKYKIFTPRNIIYYAIVAIVLIILKDYEIREFETVRNSFIKLATLVNAGTATALIIFYKIRHLFYNW